MQIALDWRAWSFASLMICVWSASIILLRRRAQPFSIRVVTTVYGIAWLAFGILYVVRIPLLAIDAESYSHLGSRMVGEQSSVMARAAMTCTLFWTMVSLSWYGVSHWRPRDNENRGQGPAHWLRADGIVFVSLVAMVSGYFLDLAPGLARPIGLISSLWVVGAALALWSCANASRKRRPYIRALVYLSAGLLMFVLDPFRERLMYLALLPIQAAALSGRRIGWRAIGAVIVGVLVAGTVLTSIYRIMNWGGASARDAYEMYRDSQAGRDREGLTRELLMRFHGFESTALTVALVPDVVPFREENAVLNSLVEAFVPRMLYPDKLSSDRAIQFALAIWDESSNVAGAANIAPSMVGDLYATAGLRSVVVGGLFWGGLLGLIDVILASRTGARRLALLGSVGMLVAGGMERDFSRASATLIQQAILTLAVIWMVIPTGRRARHPIDGVAAERRVRPIIAS